MKFLILVLSVLATAFASWEPIHDKYHGPLHYPKIHKGVPVEPAAVQHAREAHLKALSQASNDHGYSHQEHNEDTHEHHEGHKWNGPLHYPKIHQGVPVEPKEVQHAREAHLNALSHASHGHHHDEHDYEHHTEENKWHGPLHYPQIHKGVPVEPKEVQHAREAHLIALSHASHNGHRYRRGADSYVHFSSKVEHEVPVYHHEHDYSNQEYDHHDNSDSHNHDYSYEQIHAPVYGHHEDHQDENNDNGHSEKYHGPLHYPKIHKGVPVEPAAVQHAREAHLKALSQASNDHGYSHQEHNEDTHEHHENHKWNGPLHYPKIHKGVPVEPKEVQHAREAHLNALSHASHGHHHDEHDYDHHNVHHEEENKWHGPLHYPKIHKGVPVEPKEVQHAREAHLNALSHASHNGHRYRRGADSYVHFSSKVEHEVPVYHHEHDYSNQEYDHHDNSDSHNHDYSYEQIHAPVYGHHEDHQGENNDNAHSEKYHGPLHYPKIHKGVPVEPAAVQHAREAHLKALSQASNDHGYSHQEHNEDTHEHHESHKWNGPLHYPKIHKGVPIEPKEVQHAREAHLNALSHASHEHHHDEHDYDHHNVHHEEENKWHGPLHYPKIHKGVPVEPKEVQHAREAHLNALAHASHNAHRYRRGADSYVQFSSKIEHEVPVYHHEYDESHHEGNGYSYEQIHAPVYGHHEEHQDENNDEHYENNNQEHGYSYQQVHAPVYKHQGESNEHGYSYEQIHAPVYGHHESHQDQNDDSHHHEDGYSYHQTHAPVYGHHGNENHGHSYQQIHASNYGHHHDEHVPVIGHDGTPVETPEVKKAREAHLAAHAAAKAKHY